jgi:Zn-dependent protease
MIIFYILIIFFSITLHEYFHGWTAYKLGDPTPKISGRLSLNPLSHIDFFGTIILPFLLLVMSRGAFSFGYAKPVPINPYHFKRPKRDFMLVGLAGPLANISIALILAFFLKLTSLFYDVIVWGIVINLILGFFNLLPIPPLDGSKVVAYFLPSRFYFNFLRLEMVGFIIIIFLIMIGFFEWFILPLIKIALSLLGIEGVI